MTILASLVGEILVVIQSGTHEKLDFYGVLTHLNLFEVVSSILSHTSSATYFFTAVSVVLAFFVARRT